MARMELNVPYSLPNGLTWKAAAQGAQLALRVAVDPAIKAARFSVTTLLRKAAESTAESAADAAESAADSAESAAAPAESAAQMMYDSRAARRAEGKTSWST